MPGGSDTPVPAAADDAPDDAPDDAAIEAVVRGAVDAVTRGGPDGPALQLQPHETAFAREASRRYLVANRLDARRAGDALAATLRWRRDAVPPPPALPGCAACAREATSHCITCVGLLDDGRPVIYLSPPRARDLGTASCTAHLVSELEAAFALPGAAGAGVWLVDLRGFSLLQSGMNPGLGLAYVRLLAAHFPERLSQLVLATPPGYFSLFLGAITPFLDGRTAAKIVSLGTPAEVGAWLDAHAAVPPGERGEAPARPPRTTGEWLRQALALEPRPGNLPAALPPGAPPPVHTRGPAGGGGGA